MPDFELVGDRSQDSYFRMLAQKDEDAIRELHMQGYHDACGSSCSAKLEILSGAGYLTPYDQNPLFMETFEEYWQSASDWEQREAAQFEREENEHLEHIEAELSHWDDVQEELLRRKRVRNCKLS